MSQICEAGKLREADFGRESETWLGVLGEGRGGVAPGVRTARNTSPQNCTFLWF